MRSRLDKKNVKPKKHEAGYALISVLMVLIAGSMILVPLMLIMTAGLTSSHLHEERMLRFYAADAGIEHAAWIILNDDENLPQNAGSTYSYQIEDVNGYQVDVTIDNVWILTGLEDDRYGTLPHQELVTVGHITEFDQEEDTRCYSIEMSYDGSVGELKVDRVGAWLPAGFSYIPDSSGGITQHEDVPDNPTQSDFRGGTALIWDFDPRQGIKFEELPPPGGVKPGSAEFPMKRILYFEFTPAADPTGAFSWMRTTRHDVYLSWDIASGTYKVSSRAGETTVESYVARAKLHDRVSEVCGDYRAIGQSLMVDRSGSWDDWWDYGIRDRLLFGSKSPKAKVTDIPDDADVEMAYLYWSAWRRYPIDVTGYDEEALAELAEEVDEANFKVDGKQAVWVTADRVQILPNKSSLGRAHGWTYSCRADVTSLVSGNGSYRVKKTEGLTDDDTGDQWSYAGWSLIIIYSSAKEKAHQLYLYDDFFYVHNNTTMYLQGIEGFLAPEDADGRLTVFVGEGDDVWNGDKVKFNGNYLPYTADPYDGVNPQNDVWNGKSSGLGGEFIDGVDIDTFDASPYIDTGDTLAEVMLITGTDSWNLVYVILSFRTVPGTESGLFPVGIMTYTYENQ